MQYLVENHDEAFHLWVEQGWKKRTVVHIDAHSDLQYEQCLHIGSYLYHSFKEGIFNKCYWVIPEPACATPILFNKLVKNLKKNGMTVEKNHGLSIEGSIHGGYLWAGSLKHLPKLSETIILDIDIDYFTTPYTGTYNFEPISVWQTPYQLIEGLVNKSISWDSAVVCISTIGGYTPSYWRCLGSFTLDVLDGEKKTFPLIEKLLEGTKLITNQRDILRAKKFFLDAINYSSNRDYLGAIYIWLTILNIELGLISEAIESHKTAVKFDPEYDSFWTCQAFIYDFLSSKKSAALFKSWKSVFDGDAWFISAWALNSYYINNYRLSQKLSIQALNINENLPDALLVLSNTLIKDKQYNQAVPCLERLLKLMFSKVNSFYYPIRSHQSLSKRYIDPSYITNVIFNLLYCYVKSNQSEKINNLLHLYKDGISVIYLTAFKKFWYSTRIQGSQNKGLNKWLFVTNKFFVFIVSYLQEKRKLFTNELFHSYVYIVISRKIKSTL